MSLSVLADAVNSGDADAVRAALQQFPALTSHLDAPLAGHPFGTTPLIAAATKGNREMVDVLLNAGADINVRSKWWAGSFGILDHSPLEIVPFLLQCGATLDVHSAARLNRIPELTAMLDANPASVNARGGDGQTPLHFAGSVEVAALLLDRGAKIDARDIDHESTPAQYMVGDRKPVARFLVTHGCQTDILMAAALDDLELVRKHLTADPDCIYTAVSERYFPKVNPESGGSIYIWTIGLFKTAHAATSDAATADLLREYTPPDLQLLVAAQNNDTARVETLLATNPPINFEDERFTATALHWAAWHGNTAMVQSLLQKHPPLNVRDAQYHGTPLEWAQHAMRGRPTPGADYFTTRKLLSTENTLGTPFA